MPILPQENLPTLSVNSVLDKYSMLDGETSPLQQRLRNNCVSDGITKFNHIIDKPEYRVLKHVMSLLLY